MKLDLISALNSFRAVLAFSVMIAAAHPALANETPDTLAGVKSVSAEQAKALLDKGVMLVDTRVANEYAEGHAKGAVSIVYKEKSAKTVQFDVSQDSFDLSKLPSDKSKPVIFYCNAGECWKSYKASVVALGAGYKGIHWMRGGFPEWKAKGLPVE